MITAARALSFEAMKNLLRNDALRLQQNCCICIAPENLREEARDLSWPPDSDRWLSIYFEDIRPEHLQMLPEIQEHFARPLRVFGEPDADLIIRFLKQCHSRPQEETLFVNCVAGISRSGAVASFACETFHLDRHKFHNENPQIMPNNLVLYLLRERWTLQERVVSAT